MTKLTALFLALLVGIATLAGAEDPWPRLDAAVDLATDDPAAAIEALRDLLADEPGLHAAHYNLGCLLIERDSAAAARHLQRATDAPQQAIVRDAWLNLALARHRQGLLELALSAADRAVELAPDDEAAQRTRDELRRLLLERRDAARLAALAPRLSGDPLPPAWEGEAYSAELAASGGDGGPFRFQVPEDAAGWPAGLELDPDGRLHGIPAAGSAGEHRIPILIADGSGEAVRRQAPLRVLPPPRIHDARLPTAFVGVPYRASIGSEGFIGGSWTVAGLPPGLEARGAGDRLTISGTPHAPATATLTITRSDPYHHLSAERELVVEDDGFAPDQLTLPPATAWQPYEHRVGVRGRSDHYRWEGAGGGLRVSGDGRVSGTPEDPGELQLAVTIVRDGDGAREDATLDLTVNPQPVIPVDEPIRLHQGIPAAARLRADGGTPPLRWRRTESTGLDLQLGADGRLGGIAPELGQYELAVEVEDRWGATARARIPVVVEEPPPSPQQQQDQQSGDQHGQDGESGGSQSGEPQQGEQGQESGQAPSGERSGDRPDQSEPGSPGDAGEQSGEQEQPGADTGEPQTAGREPGAADSPSEPGRDGSGTTGERGEEAQGITRHPEDGEGATAGDHVPLRLDEQAARRWLEQLPDEPGTMRLFLVPRGGLEEARERQREQPW